MKSLLTIVKTGGKIIEEQSCLDIMLKQFSLIAGNKILVHGGGRSATDIAAKLGMKSQMIEGRRVTDADMLKVVTMVYAGLVNKNIVAGLQSLSIDAVGLTGADMNLVISSKRPLGEIDFGFVADVKTINARALILLLQHNYVPVLAPLSHDGHGQLLNTNADTIASEIARALTFDYKVRLIYCFEKPGVMLDENDENSVIRELNRDLYRQYKEKGIIREGMITKLDNAFNALAQGVDEVIITSASQVSKGVGTVIFK
jgi:acetylglutamate kinase